MAIHVICPGCHKRFQVNDKFAGKKGPCPKCKTTITIPAKSEDVVVHGPEDFGPKGTEGKGVLKPIFREETKFSPLVAGGIAGATVVVLLIAWLMRVDDPANAPTAILFVGALVLGPPLAFGGYTFLRDGELESFVGKDLWVRVALCGFGYAITWYGVAGLELYFELDQGFEVWMSAFVAPLMVVVGTFVAFLCFDFEMFGPGLLHYGFFLVVTMALRWVMGLAPFPVNMP